MLIIRRAGIKQWSRRFLFPRSFNTKIDALMADLKALKQREPDAKVRGRPARCTLSGLYTALYDAAWQMLVFSQLCDSLTATPCKARYTTVYVVYGYCS